MMVWTGGTRAAAGGPRQSAETGNARAETLGPDGGQQTWKPGPGVAEEGPTDAKESPHILFPLSMPTPGEGAGAGGGGPRGMGAAVGRPGAGRGTRRGRLREQRRGKNKQKKRQLQLPIRSSATCLYLLGSTIHLYAFQKSVKKGTKIVSA